MGLYNRHHFVPQVYLRIFATDVNGHPIGLFNLPNSRFVQSASIRNQAQRKNLLGTHGGEQTLCDLEGASAAVIKRMIERKEVPEWDETDHFTLLGYVLFQAHRTPAAELEESNEQLIKTLAPSRNDNVPSRSGNASTRRSGAPRRSASTCARWDRMFERPQNQSRTGMPICINRTAGLMLLVLLLALLAPARADWPTLRGDPTRRGRADVTLAPPYQLKWSRHFQDERIGTAVEPIVADGAVFVTTHGGSLYSLDAATGEPRWRVAFPGPMLHSPSWSNGKVVAADATGCVAIVDAGTGALLHRADPDPAGFSAAPLVADGMAVIGSRDGDVYGIDLDTGAVRWKQDIGAPVRQTAASHDGQVYLTGEDLRVRRLDLRDGSIGWTSEALAGQTARDYFPVIVAAAGKTYVIVRTNPSIQFSQRIAQDSQVVCRLAGIDCSGWEKIDAHVKDENSLGGPADWEREQAGIERFLKEEPSARTFFVLDAATGAEAMTAPILWVGGCQGVGNPPVVMPDGRLAVMYRSAHSNWNHGVAPLVALGLYDLSKNRIEPLRHAHGMQPPWNTFWGTADEAQNFLALRLGLLIIHQSTLSHFDPASHMLSAIWGERDSWAGFRNLPWARNEWNGPARGGVAVDGERLYWCAGSRVLCIEPRTGAPAGEDREIAGATVARQTELAPTPLDAERPGEVLAATVEGFLSKRWAPLYVEPGLAGRDFFFDNSGEVFECLSRVFPVLPPQQQERVKHYLAAEWKRHPPFDRSAWYPLEEGERREWFAPRPEALSRIDEPHHPFGNMYAVWLYAEACGEWERVLDQHEGLAAGFESFLATGWRLDAQKGDLHANRYAAALFAYHKVAERAGNADHASQAKKLHEETVDALAAWWRLVAERAQTPVLKDIGEWDRFITGGDALFFRVVPHRAKIALFHDLTPEVAAQVREQAGIEAIEKVWGTFERLCPTWHLVAEERQVHYGENLYDPPDFAANAFRAAAWLMRHEQAALRRRVDITWGRADLLHAMKIALSMKR